MKNSIITTRPIIIGIVLISLLSGCASMTGIKPHAALLDSETLGLNLQAEEGAPDTVSWWTRYQSPVLDSLIAIAVRDNASLKMAQARVRQADAMASLAGSRDGPDIDVGASVRHGRLSSYGEIPAPLGGSIISLYDSNLNFGYVFDVWGKTRAQVAAAVSERAALLIEAQEARRVLALAVSSRYFQLKALNEDIALLNKAIEARQGMTEVLQAQHKAGIVQKDQPDWMHVQLQSDLETLTNDKAQAEKIRNALAVLLGTTSAQLPPLDMSGPLPAPRLNDLERLNTNMLGLRADIRAAKWRVESYRQSVEAAKAEFYPTLSLSAFLGFNALHLADWFKRDAYQSGVIPAINLPVFHAGELRANLRGTTAQYDLAVENYNQTLLTAVQDAADKFTDLSSSELNLQRNMAAAQSARSAETIAANRLKAGILPRLNYLDVRSKRIQAERQLNAARNNRLQSELAMIQAMGGEDVNDRMDNKSVEKQ